MEFEIESREKCLNRDDSVTEVPVIVNGISYSDFFNNYMVKNVPCIIKKVTQQWESSCSWLLEDKPNVEYLQNTYGTCDITVYDCTTKYFNSHKTEPSTFKTYLTHWDDGRSKYLKDWHLKNTHKDDNFYEVPIYFASDWLNEYLVATSQDDYRFVYMGPKGTWTPFHADVFNSFSWSANVCGRKRWVLFPPGEENCLRDALNNFPFDIGEVYETSNHFELIQEQGDAIFVPSGWFHQVWNLEDTISINHNWINGCNIEFVWESIKDNLGKVKKEIEDCRDMENFIEHCQVMLNASYGMDFFRFYDFIKFIGDVRMGGGKKLFHGHILGRNHALFDLKMVKNLVNF